jgi:Ca-activated chloride channel family protein
MTFQPVLPAVVLIAIASAIVAIRLLALWQLLAQPAGRARAAWRWCGVTLAVLLLLGAASRPGIDPGGQPAAAIAPSGANVNVFFVVDRSGDIEIDDYGDGKSRMDGIRADIDSLIARYPQARFAVIGFASRPSMDWPLSQDVWSLEPMIARLAPHTVVPGAEDQVDAAAAANVLRYQLIAAGQQYRDSTNLVFYFGSGASGSRATQGEFDLGTGSVDGGAVFGYGIPSHAPSALNEPGLRRISEQLGVPYVHRQGDQPVAQAAPNLGFGKLPVENPAAAVEVVERAELYWVLSLLAATLLLLEVYLTVREFRRNRMARRDVPP